MAGLSEISSVSLNKSKGRPYFKTSIPFSVGKEVLGLNVDVMKQRLSWEVKDGQIMVRRVR